ncbi:MAG: bifunctional phosphoribosylaminoimidazolecarboxamide formyltransferase/IMP cyclohydrolase [Limnochorda sp.]|uniref:bifunctional phosphoribosylaminoimidazolecarboxamide formyltransferase/IMP cyclohydrolase n=1 Tax=Limnochorda sp. TaxID=1940279 RepID=UPI0039702628
MERALLSVWSKEGLAQLAEALHQRGVELLSTGGTARYLQEHGLPVTELAQVTGAPEVLGGRVKSLHPAVYAGILARRRPGEEADLARVGARPIDLVCVNLYPFEEQVRRETPLDEALELVDIGGVSLLRAAAKAFPHVVVLSRPDQYPEFLERLAAGRLDLAYRRRLAAEALARTAAYDEQIAAYLAAGLEALDRPEGPEDALPASFPETYTLRLVRAASLRYGENPHQAAAFYRPEGPAQGLAAARLLQGKALSFNNLNDGSAAWRLLGGLSQAFPGMAAAVAVKHTNPCGAAVAPTLAEAFRKAYEADPVSIFGGIVALNRPVDRATAELMAPLFLEVVLAPGFSEEARQVLARKPSLRLLELQGHGGPRVELRPVWGGYLLQEPDDGPASPEGWRLVTQAAVDPRRLPDLLLAWQVVRGCFSNAIVVAAGGQTLGIGAGQVNRIDAARHALERARARVPGGDLRNAGAVLASDGFFPFPDVVEVAAAAGICAIVQPGGSKRDGESIAAADRAGIPMLFTGRRHFRHA